MTKLLCKLCMGVANWPLWEIILYCNFTVGSGVAVNTVPP